MAYQPKNYKKFVATAATATLVASAIAPAAFADSASTSAFSDVGDRYTEAVDYVVSNNIANGLSETQFGVSASITRGDAAIMIAKAAGLMDEKAPASGFSDVPARGAIAVNSLKAAGIISGVSTTKFGWDQSITRGQAAFMLAQAYKLESGDASKLKFTDVGTTHRFAKEVAALVENEITAGTTPTSFGIESSIKRGDFAIFLHKLSKLEEAPTTPEVASVSAINGKEMEIKFNKAIKEDTVVDSSGNLINVTVTAVGSSSTAITSPKATLSDDGKTLTVTATAQFKGEYAVTVPNTVETIDNEELKAFSTIVKTTDTTRPSISNVTYSDFQTAVVTFSEPLTDLGSVTTNNANIVVGSLSADGKSVTVNLANSGVLVDTNYTVTIVGAKDFNNNLISPNPVEVSVKKSSADTVKPVVSTLSTVNDKSFEVKFSEKLITNPTIKVNGNTVVSATPGAGEVQGTITKDNTGLVYTVALTNSLVTGPDTSALATIQANFVDLSGNAADTFNRIVEFKTDTTAPALANSAVQTINGKEFLILNFNENVTPQNAKSLTGTVVKDFVESAASIITDTETNTTPEVNFTLNDAVNGKSKSVKLDLSTLTSGSYKLALPSGLVVDEASLSNAVTNVSFTRTTNVDTGKPELTSAGTNGITKVNNNTYTVSYDRQLDASSALNLNNYSIEGATINNAIFTQNAANGAVVRLTLADNSVTLNGERTVMIQNVKSISGVMMDKVTTTEVITENVKPTVTSAQFTALDKIKVVFSENIKESTLDVIGTAGDLDVMIGDVSETGATVAEDTTDTSGKTFIITLFNPVTTAEYAKTLTLKAGTGVDVTDENSNALSFTSTTIAK